MILYLSGNFPQLVVSTKEKAFKDDLLKRDYPYHRLVTFYYPKHVNTVLNIIQEELDEQRDP